MRVVVVEPLVDVESLDELAVAADREGHRMVGQLVRDWRDGTNRFDQPGECVCVALLGPRVVGVCGLNRDPYATEGDVGRVRRLYVAADCRRRGVASALLDRVLGHARDHFKRLHVRTYDEHAGAFYESRGFSSVDGGKYCTHRRTLD